MRRNVLIITGTRAEYGLLRSSIQAVQHSEKLHLLLLVTGMHTLKRYGQTINEIKGDKIPIACTVPLSPHRTMLTALADEIRGISSFCTKKRIHCILVLGDRDEAFAGAIVGGHLGIPVAHIHGGDRTGRTIVDNTIRNAITQFATFHFAATPKSYRRIIRMRGSRKNVFLVGAPGLDEIRVMKRQSKSDLARALRLSEDKPWIVILHHPEPLSPIPIQRQIKAVLSSLPHISGEKVIIYPNTDTGSTIFIREIKQFAKTHSCHVFRNIQRGMFLQLLSHADLLIGNSSLGIIESASFHLPVVNIGERQKNREHSTNIISSPYNQNRIIASVKKACSESFLLQCQRVKNIYGDGRSGEKIITILEKKLT